MFRQATCLSHYDIFVFTETGLNNMFCDSWFSIHGHNIFRADRSLDSSDHNRFGGVLIAVNKDFECFKLNCPSSIEQLFILVKYKCMSFIVGSV